jgi:hypothetical protein
MFQVRLELRQDTTWIGSQYAGSDGTPQRWSPHMASPSGNTSDAAPEPEPEAEAEPEAEPGMLPARARRYVHMEHHVEWSARQSEFDYFYEPFDNNKMVVTMVIEGANITTCSMSHLATFLHPSLNAADGQLSLAKQARLLPRNRGWETHCNEGASAIRLKHPTGPDGRPVYSECEISILIRRFYWPTVVKEILPNVLAVLTGLLALYLDPHQAPLVGGRCSLLIVSMLVVINTSRLSQSWPGLMWINYVRAVALEADHLLPVTLADCNTCAHHLDSH